MYKPVITPEINEKAANLLISLIENQCSIKAVPIDEKAEKEETA